MEPLYVQVCVCDVCVFVSDFILLSCFSIGMEPLYVQVCVCDVCVFVSDFILLSCFSIGMEPLYVQVCVCDVCVFVSDFILLSCFSIGMEPLYVQVCVKQPVVLEPWEDYVAPQVLSTLLVSLPCSLSFHRDENISFIQLIAEVSDPTLIGIKQNPIEKRKSSSFIALPRCFDKSIL